ncbi:MAG: hypothetical protein M3Y54_20690, partial [Bacteroidota bacterium]|nr:hypothetical protein [Bacteroidota bacterium]
MNFVKTPSIATQKHVAAFRKFHYLLVRIQRPNHGLVVEVVQQIANVQILANVLGILSCPEHLVSPAFEINNFVAVERHYLR